MATTKAGEIAGRATTQGTARYAARATRGAGHFRAASALGGLAASTLGIGTYLGQADDATDAAYQDAVLAALAGGVNVVDTAVNYRHQRSERAVGAALAEAIALGTVARDEVIVATKGGFLSFDGARPADPRAYLAETYLRPGILAPGELVAGCHVMTPRWIEDQIARSRRNLRVETIDIYYVHNPETQLEEVGAAELVVRARAAFEALERACDAGAIACYGTATWSGYRVPPGEQGHLALEALLGAARDVAGDAHRFRVLQLPYSPMMREACDARTQAWRGGAASILAAAADAGLYVMTSGTLQQGGLASDAVRTIRLVRSTPGVGTALVGMSRRAHVEENLRALDG